MHTKDAISMQIKDRKHKAIIEQQEQNIKIMFLLVINNR